MSLFNFPSTSGQIYHATFADIVLNSLAPDGSLYMLPDVPQFKQEFLDGLIGKPFHEMAYEVSKHLLGAYVDDELLEQICYESFNFLIPFIPLGPEIYVMELFHGPSGAFKDFGARFMARLLPVLAANDTRVLDILVATSGDTGGAIAAGFHNVPNTRVTILYPKGKVSKIQEAQLTTLGGNIRALKVNGNFDDCQDMVKLAFQDKELCQKLQITSANSINLARMLPQAFYYVWAWMHLSKSGLPIVISVPSGNFGNVCAGLLMKRLGLPIHSFIAANNMNHPYGDYILTGVYKTDKAVPTISNAMDIGNPSNLARIFYMYGHNRYSLARDLFPSWCADHFTTYQIENIYKLTGYIMEPHTAVGFQGLEAFSAHHHFPFIGLVLATAHPAKFMDVMPKNIAAKVQVPDSMKGLLDKESHATEIEPNYAALKHFLLTN